MIRAIHLHGGLGRRFGQRFDLDVETPAEAVRALTHMIRGFREAISQGSYRVVRGRMGLPVDGLHLRFGACPELHIVPAPSGGKNAGMGKVIMGVVLIAAAVVTAGAALGAFGAGAAAFVGGGAAVPGTVAGAMGASAIGVGGVLTVSQLGFMGLGMVLTGVTQMLSPQPKSTTPLTVEQKPSFLFAGPTNTSAQGGPVPLVYGQMRVGSVVGGSALKAEEYTANPTAEATGISQIWKLAVAIARGDDITPVKA